MAGQKKEQTQIIVILLLVCVWGVGIMMNKGKNKVSREESIMALKKALGSVSAKGASLLKEYKREIQAFIGKRDPLQKPEVVIEKEKAALTKKKKTGPTKKERVKGKGDESFIDTTQYDLQGIVWGEKNPVAIISGEVVGVGDIILGAEILEVQKEKVILLYGTQKFQIEMER